MTRESLIFVLAGLALAACDAVGAQPSDRPSSSPGDSATVARPQESDAARPTREPDVIFVPTPDKVIHRMLTMAKLGPRDVLYDLGCGDGRIVIAAARDFGARAVGIDIDPQRVKEARANVKAAGLEDKVEIRQGDMFQLDTSPATVVSLYLLESLNVKLRPKLQRELRSGARIVSQSFSMGDWKPDAKVQVEGRPVYLWTIKDKTARK